MDIENPKKCYQCGELCSKINSAVLLTVQNAATILLLRYIRTLPGQRFLNTTAVFFAEIFKSVFSLAFLTIENKSIRKSMSVIMKNLTNNTTEVLKTCIPALLYSIQNNLLYVSISNLDAATFQVTYQIKILTTAICLMILMKRKIGITQWISLVILFIGVAMIQVQELRGEKKKDIRPLLGLLSVLSACIISGIAGVYLEKVFKHSNTSIWLKNIELAVFSTLFCALTMFIVNGKTIAKSGICLGYSPLVWLSIIIQSFGGMIVAVVIKKFDNIVKGFSTSASLIIACVVSVLFLDSTLTWSMFTGATLVVAAILLYVYAIEFKWK